MTVECYSIDTANIRDDGVPVFRSIEDPSVPLSQAAALLSAGESASGVPINRSSALGYDAVWRAVNLISTTVAKLPLIVYRREGEGKERDRNHPAYRLLRYDPHPTMTSLIFRQTLMGHVLLQGNGYAYIVRSGSGDPVRLVLLDPDSTYPVKVNGRLWYLATIDDVQVQIDADNMLHIKGLGFDGLCGYSVLSMARESLGLGLAARGFGSVYFKNGAKASGVLMYPSKLKQAAIDSLRESWEKVHAGVLNQHKLAILEDGVKFQQLTIPPNDSQFLETRSFSRVEVANWFQVPPHKIGDNSKSSYNSLEQENQAWLDEGLDGWLVNWEEESRKKLLREAEKDADSHSVEYIREALLHTNLAARGAYYRTAVTGGWMNRDEVRARENLNPLPNGEGKKFFVPLNLSIAGEKPPETAPAPDPADDADDEETDEEEPTDDKSDDEGRSAAIDAVFAEGLPLDCSPQNPKG